MPLSISTNIHICICICIYRGPFVQTSLFSHFGHSDVSPVCLYTQKNMRKISPVFLSCIYLSLTSQLNFPPSMTTYSIQFSKKLS